MYDELCSNSGSLILYYFSFVTSVCLSISFRDLGYGAGSTVKANRSAVVLSSLHATTRNIRGKQMTVSLTQNVLTFGKSVGSF
jgi:hypothetical protein